MSEPCANPLCANRLPEDARSDKRFCCDDCRLDAWVLARAAQLLFKLAPAHWYKILEIGRKNGSESGAISPPP